MARQSVNAGLASVAATAGDTPTAQLERAKAKLERMGLLLMQIESLATLAQDVQSGNVETTENCYDLLLAIETIADSGLKTLGSRPVED